MILDSEHKASIYFALHELYKYPVKCLNCNVRVRVSDTKGLFECDCRVIAIDYECGVHHLGD